MRQHGRPCYIQDIASHVGKEIAIKGWLADRTDKGRLQFLRVRDGTGFFRPVVFQKDVSPEAFENVKRLTQESSFIVNRDSARRAASARRL